jgi:hypothetical protein
VEIAALSGLWRREPKEALDLFLPTGMDLLVIGESFIERRSKND